ncbi:UDP-N-acetylglucosamine 1-carboxyvinyltransferase, partial [Desulfofundulus sp.]|uniref:UDP-N-acetylglucosamine 1-carboxyvinyltransferase n=1 Tax=Desulfofundulus sp. TaxID=2282750 RepID=UPI003C78A14B
TMCDVLDHLGARVQREGDSVRVETTHIQSLEVGEDLMRRMRASNLVLGPLLGRFRRVRISYPGGCNIGSRPMNLHLKGLKAMGARIDESFGYITVEADKLVGAEIHLDVPSVGATENIMMAAVLAEGTTIIRNAAKEPEIVDLQNFLNRMGARIKGAGTDVIRIEGVKHLYSVEHVVIPDRIEAGTHLVAGAITGGDVTVTNVIPEHLEPVLAKLKEMGFWVETGDEHVRVVAQGRPRAVDIKTLPHPGFPTDMQPQMMALACLAEGTSIITETVFENRFKHVSELRRMGADIKVEGQTAIVKGVERLTGAPVMATDLRAGAALVLAALAAENGTVVEGVEHIDRGYERLEQKYTALGAKIMRVST